MEDTPRIIHFIEIAIPSTVNFIRDLFELIPGRHLVINQDPWALKAWTIDEKIPVYKAMQVSPEVQDRFKPDIILNYTAGLIDMVSVDSTELPERHPGIVIGVNQPFGDNPTTAMINVKKYEQTTHYLNPSQCKVVDLGQEQGLDRAHLAFQRVPWDEETQEYQEVDLRRMAEAMACGIPVVTNRTPQTSQMVFNGVNGLLTPDETMIQDGLQQLIADPDTRNEFGNSAVEWVREVADIQYVVDKIQRHLKGN